MTAHSRRKLRLSSQLSAELTEKLVVKFQRLKPMGSGENISVVAIKKSDEWYNTFSRIYGLNLLHIILDLCSHNLGVMLRYSDIGMA